MESSVGGKRNVIFNLDYVEKEGSERKRFQEEQKLKFSLVDLNS